MQRAKPKLKRPFFPQFLLHWAEQEANYLTYVSPLALTCSFFLPKPPVASPVTSAPITCYHYHHSAPDRWQHAPPPGSGQSCLWARRAIERFLQSSS